MATADDIFKIQKELFAAYPPNTFGRRAMVGYEEFLRDIPGPVLLAAARAHICKRDWFPRIPDLRLEASRLARKMIFDEGLDPALIERQLFGMEIRLGAENFRGEELDVEAWEMLITAYAQIGLKEKAQRLRARLQAQMKTAGV
jgi:hypothetical protein